jgi:outer membrane murein-binding lipoprotein Lpp
MKNKIFLSLAAFVIAGFVLTGCSKDNSDDDSSGLSTIKANVENGNNYNSKIDSVKAMAYPAETSQYNFIGTAIANAKYANGGFTLTLPEKLDDQYLELVDMTDIREGLEVSDNNFKTCFVNLIAYKSGVPVGGMIYSNQGGDSGSGAEFIYVDRNVSITGSGSEDEYDYTYNVSIKKGWNILYYIENSTSTRSSEEYTSKAPSGMKWYFEEYNSDGNLYQMKAGSTIGNHKFSLFK